MYKCIQRHDFASFQHTDGFLVTFPSCSRHRASMRKGGFRPTPGDYCPLSVVHCQERRLPLTAEEVFWQNVKRRTRQCPSSHQNTIGWIPRPFSGDLQNTHWHKFAPSVIISTQPKSGILPIRQQDSHTAHMMKPSDLLTRLTFQRTKPGVFAFHPPNIWLPRMKQYCLGSETILFDSSNTCVSHVKQYCLSLKM